MIDPIRDFIEREGLLVLDGGLATELEALGCDLNDPLWSARVLIDDPAVIRAAHRRFLEAGADCIATSTYQATFEGFRARGLDAAATTRLLRDSVDLAISARADFLAGRPASPLGAPPPSNRAAPPTPAPRPVPPSSLLSRWRPTFLKLILSFARDSGYKLELLRPIFKLCMAFRALGSRPASR